MSKNKALPTDRRWLIMSKNGSIYFGSSRRVNGILYGGYFLNKITRSSRWRLNRIFSIYHANIVTPQLDEKNYAITFFWDDMRHYNGVMMDADAMQSKLKEASTFSEAER